MYITYSIYAFIYSSTLGPPLLNILVPPLLAPQSPPVLIATHLSHLLEIVKQTKLRGRCEIVHHMPTL